MPTQPPIHSAVSASPVTPHDTTEIPPTRSLYVGVSGDIQLKFVDDSAPITLKNVPIGTHPWCVRLVMATGTTASEIVAMR